MIPVLTLACPSSLAAAFAVSLYSPSTVEVGVALEVCCWVVDVLVVDDTVPSGVLDDVFGSSVVVNSVDDRPVVFCVVCCTVCMLVMVVGVVMVVVRGVVIMTGVDAVK